MTCDGMRSLKLIMKFVHNEENKNQYKELIKPTKNQKEKLETKLDLKL